jgi:hypothetical protein
MGQGRNGSGNKLVEEFLKKWVGEEVKEELTIYQKNQLWQQSQFLVQFK